jgi:hypothetical protein
MHKNKLKEMQIQGEMKKMHNKKQKNSANTSDFYKKRQNENYPLTK